MLFCLQIFFWSKFVITAREVSVFVTFLHRHSKRFDGVKWSHSKNSDWVMDWMTEESWLESWQGQNFLSSKTSRPVLGHTQLLHKGSWGLFSGTEQLTAHLNQCQSEDCWALELYPLIFLCGKNRHSFTCTVDVFLLFGLFQRYVLLLVVPKAGLSKLMAHRNQWCHLLTFR